MDCTQSLLVRTSVSFIYCGLIQSNRTRLHTLLHCSEVQLLCILLCSAFQKLVSAYGVNITPSTLLPSICVPLFSLIHLPCVSEQHGVAELKSNAYFDCLFFSQFSGCCLFSSGFSFSIQTCENPAFYFSRKRRDT